MIQSPSFFAVALGLLTFGCGEPRRPDGASGIRAPPVGLAGLDSLVAVADSFYGAGDYARAKEAWSAGLALLERGRDHAVEARVLTSLGLTEWRLGEYEAGRTRTEHARALLEANGPRELLPRTYNALGLIAWDQGRLSEAAVLWRRTMQIAREVGDQEYVDKPAMNLGLWYAGIGDLESAREAFAASLTAGRQLGIRPLELRSLVNLAMVANRMGEPRLALAWLDSAAGAAVQDDFLAEDNYRSQLAIAAWTLGDPGVAMAGLDSSVREARRRRLPQSEAANLTLLADIYWEAGDPVRALGLHAQAEAIHRELDLPTEQGQNLLSSARIEAAMGHTQLAQVLASRALALHRQAQELGYQLDDHLLLAELGSHRDLMEARRIVSQRSTRAARINLGLAEAHLATSAGRPLLALRALTSIAPDLASGLSAEIAEAEAVRAAAFTSLAQWDSAVAAGRRASAALDRIRSGYGSGLLRASFGSFRAEAYGNLVGALLALGRNEEAFEVADAARGGWQGSSRSTTSGHREALLRQISSIETEVRDREKDGLDTGELMERLRGAEREYEIALLSAGGEAAGGTQQNASVGSVRRAMGPDDLMLAYLVTPERLFVFALTARGTEVHAVAVRAVEVEARVRLVRQMLADPTTMAEEAEAVLGTLSQWLLGPLTPGRSDGVRRLVIVPHGVLAYLPFGALKAAGGAYLVERYSLIHLPSAAFASTPSSRGGGASATVTAMAPLPGELPGTALEAHAIGRARRGAQVLVGRRADESALRRALGSGDITHVASHGLLNRMNPLFSRIELAPSRSRSSADDGRLEVHEVLGLDIRSPLVFLSGCETGLGPGGSRRYSPGEDYATLAAAFLAAGAGQVVATLWAIPDTGAAAFASRFYAELGRTGTADALAATQRALLAQPRFRHPYYWAGYRLAGLESSTWRTAVS